MLSNMQEKITTLVSENATVILTASGVVGSVATAIFAGRAGFKAGQIHTAIKVEEFVELEPSAEMQPVSKTDVVKQMWPHFIPPLVLGGATIAAIIFSHRMSASKAAALAAAYGLSEKQFKEYKDKVAEKMSPNKQKQLKDELAQDRVNRNPGHNNIVILEGEVLCFDEIGGRYFKASMEKVQRAAAKANEQIFANNYIDLEYFYGLLDLPETRWASEIGWNLDNIIDLDITSTITEDGKPCLCIDFKSRPTPDYTTPSYSS